MKKIYFLLSFILLAGFGFGQVTIKSCGFETSGDTWGYTDGHAKWGNWGVVTSQSGISPYSGSRLWGMNDLDSRDDTYLEFENVDISGYTSVEISFYWTHDAFDNGDDMFYSVSYDNGLSWETEVKFLDGGTGADPWTKETISITDAKSQVALRIRAKQNGGADDGAWDDVLIEGVTASIDPEPTNHVADFSALANSSSQITLTWTDALDGTQAPSGYLIKAAADPALITAPTDTNAESDGVLVNNIAHGVGTAIFTGLDASTTYNFEIWSYTNSGANINYKTDGSVPSDNETTDVAPSTITFVEDFDTGGNWAGGVSTGYNAKTYVNDTDDPENDGYSTNDAVRETSETNSGSYAWRLDDQSGAYFMYQGLETITEFSVYAARWDNSPKPGVTVEYSDDSGGSWNEIDTFDGDNFNGDKTYKKLTYNSFGSISPDASETLQIRFRTTTGERMLYDDFSVTYEPAGTAGLWTGATSNDWHTASNWDDASVPDASTNVEIPVGATNYPTISASASCNNLTLKSDASGDASLIGQGQLTINGTATVEQYVTGFAGGDPGWHFLSSPMAGYTIAGSDFEPGSGVDDLYEWSESTNTWINYYTTFGDTEFTEGKGYLIAYSAAGVKSFTGGPFSLNFDAFPLGLSYTVEQGKKGYNLLGNPYTSAIDWDLVDKSAGDIDASVAVVKASDGSYIYWNGSAGDLTDGIIPPHQGFFVLVSAATNLTINPTDQVHPNNKFYKAENTFTETLKVSLQGQESENNTYFQFRDDATSNFDNHADAEKIFGWATIAQLYSELDDTKYAINCLPHSDEVITVPLGIKINTNEDLSLDFSGLDSFYNTIRIDLEDLKTGETINVRENPSYSFSAETSDAPNRFLLHFNGVTAVSEIDEVQAPIVYAVDQAIYINSGLETSADIYIYNINGQLLGQDFLDAKELKKVNMHRAAGMYLVHIKTANGVFTQKVIIK